MQRRGLNRCLKPVNFLLKPVEFFCDHSDRHDVYSRWFEPESNIEPFPCQREEQLHHPQNADTVITRLMERPAATRISSGNYRAPIDALVA
jgi:hypothetical protein